MSGKYKESTDRTAHFIVFILRIFGLFNRGVLNTEIIQHKNPEEGRTGIETSKAYFGTAFSFVWKDSDLSFWNNVTSLIIIL